MPTTFTLVPMPHWYFADNFGRPVTGSMSTYRSLNKNIPKSVFSDPAGTLPYTNPMNFASNGELPQPSNGMIFWADDEPYFVQIWDGPNGTGNLLYQFDGYGPGISGGGGGGPVTSTNAFLENYITNNVFFRNAGTLVNPTNGTFLAPSNHEGFRQQDILYLKTGSADIETISFPTNPGDFSPGNNPLVGDVTPETYLSWSCTVASGDSGKVVQFPIDLHSKNLESQTMTAMVWLKLNGGSNLSVTMNFVQDFGSGATVSPQVFTTIPINANPITNTWQLYLGTFTVPSTAGKTLSAGGDDSSYIQVGFPSNKTGVIFMTKPKLYLGTLTSVFPELPTYDYVDRIISSPRTGSTMQGYMTMAPGGWVIMNDGTIGSASSLATTRANIDTWQLYNLLWTNVSNPSANALCAVTGGLGASAIADFSANKSLQLPLILGRALASAGSGSGLTPRSLATFVGEENHVLTVSELAAHNHGISGAQFVTTGAGGNNFGSGAASTGTAAATTDTGSNSGHNTMQPTGFMNVFIKL